MNLLSMISLNVSTASVFENLFMGLIYSLNVFYLIALLVIFGYSLLQAYLLFRYFNAPKDTSAAEFDRSEWPKVTIQIPVYNEEMVIERVIRTMGKIDYPQDKLQIQILDDSDDQTTVLAEQAIEVLRRDRNVTISLVRRSKREGFKAGALRDAMHLVEGDFIAIFDADFVPNPDFLKKTVPYFEDKTVGVVQTRWGHLNKQKKMLTELQAFGLNGHFSIEQTGRNSSGHFINFNGTGGVWRKSCIIDAGGWTPDTLTEDLDLSYRAQMKGWNFKYLENVESPAELPETMLALKNQQHRWMKGGAECFLKNAKKLMNHPNVSMSEKVNGLLHLFNSSVFVFIFLLAFLSVPVIIIRVNYPYLNAIYRYETIFFISTLILFIYYFVSFRDKTGRWGYDLFFFLIRFIQFLTVSLGLSYNNSKAVTEAYLGRKSGFVRTPKFNGAKVLGKISDYPKRKKQFFTEIALLCYFIVGLFYAIFNAVYGLIPFQLMIVMGYSYVTFYTFKDIYNLKSYFILFQKPKTISK